MTIKAWLEGHEFDLQDLAELLAEGDVRVVHDPDQDAYCLTAPEIDNPTDGTTFYDVAQRLLPRINGIGRANKADFRPVQLTGRYGSPTGQHMVAAALSSEIRFRGHAAGFVTGPDGQPEPDPPSPWPDRFALAATHPDVAEVLEIMGRVQPLNWDDLWKVFEIIREAVRPDTIVTLTRTTAADLDSFKESANHPDVSGDGARHARRPEQPQHRKMEIAEGRSYISNLVTQWLDSMI
jgi:hypothetical protein